MAGSKRIAVVAVFALFVVAGVAHAGSYLNESPGSTVLIAEVPCDGRTHAAPVTVFPDSRAIYDVTVSMSTTAMSAPGFTNGLGHGVFRTGGYMLFKHNIPGVPATRVFEWRWPYSVPAGQSLEVEGSCHLGAGHTAWVFVVINWFGF